MESMNNLVDINALVTRCCWKAYVGDLEGEAFLEECIALKEGISKIKESYVNLLCNIDNLFMVAGMYHCKFKRET